jgi:hypothetical protein
MARDTAYAETVFNLARLVLFGTQSTDTDGIKEWGTIMTSAILKSQNELEACSLRENLFDSLEAKSSFATEMSCFLIPLSTSKSALVELPDPLADWLRKIENQSISRLSKKDRKKYSPIFYRLNTLNPPVFSSDLLCQLGAPLIKAIFAYLKYPLLT